MQESQGMIKRFSWKLTWNWRFAPPWEACSTGEVLCLWMRYDQPMTPAEMVESHPVVARNGKRRCNPCTVRIHFIQLNNKNETHEQYLFDHYKGKWSWLYNVEKQGANWCGIDHLHNYGPGTRFGASQARIGCVVWTVSHLSFRFFFCFGMSFSEHCCVPRFLIEAGLVLPSSLMVFHGQVSSGSAGYLPFVRLTGRTFASRTARSYAMSTSSLRKKFRFHARA